MWSLLHRNCPTLLMRNWAWPVMLTGTESYTPLEIYFTIIYFSLIHDSDMSFICLKSLTLIVHCSIVSLGKQQRISKLHITGLHEGIYQWPVDRITVTVKYFTPTVITITIQLLRSSFDHYDHLPQRHWGSYDHQSLAVATISSIISQSKIWKLPCYICPSRLSY